MAEPNKTVSEVLFEQYLRECGISDFRFEPDVIGTSKHPDYAIQCDCRDIFFEVKEFGPFAEPTEAYHIDPCGPIRTKIDEARQKFRGMKGRVCSLVIGNPHDAPVFFDPLFVFGAMLGDVTIAFPRNQDTGDFTRSQPRQEFGEGGSMVRWKEGHPIASQNTTISSVCCLSRVFEGRRRLRLRIVTRQREVGRELTPQELFALIDAARGTDADPSIHRVRLVIFDNPDARAPLGPSFGNGPFDERYIYHDSCITRVFTGAGLAALKAEETALGIHE